MAFRKYKPKGKLPVGFYRLKKDVIEENGNMFEKGTIVELEDCGEFMMIDDGDGHRHKYMPINSKGDYGSQLIDILEKTQDIKTIEATIDSVERTDYLEEAERKYKKKHPIGSRILKLASKFPGGETISEEEGACIAVGAVTWLGSFIGFSLLSSLSLGSCIFASIIAGSLISVILWATLESLMESCYNESGNKQEDLKKLRKIMFDLDEPMPALESNQTEHKEPVQLTFGKVNVEQYGDLVLVRSDKSGK